MNETSHLNIGKVQSAKERHRPLKEVSEEKNITVYPFMINVDGSSAEGSIKERR